MFLLNPRALSLVFFDTPTLCHIFFRHVSYCQRMLRSKRKRERSLTPIILHFRKKPLSGRRKRHLGYADISLRLASYGNVTFVSSSPTIQHKFGCYASTCLSVETAIWLVLELALGRIELLWKRHRMESGRST